MYLGVQHVVSMELGIVTSVAKIHRVVVAAKRYRGIHCNTCQWDPQKTLLLCNDRVTSDTSYN